MGNRKYTPTGVLGSSTPGGLVGCSVVVVGVVGPVLGSVVLSVVVGSSVVVTVVMRLLLRGVLGSFVVVV